MTTYDIDPLTDARWAVFVEKHADASIFHSIPWLRALRMSYGYEPFAITTSAPYEAIENAVVACRVESWLTGNRIVSLPFSDHCQPLVQDASQTEVLMNALVRSVQKRRKYLEIRPLYLPAGETAGLKRAETYCLHRLDLRPPLEEIFARFHRSCIQRKIERATRERLVCEEGRSETLLKAYYELTVLTRLRQQLPPQPMSWFRNLCECMGSKLNIHVARKDEVPVAGILTLRHGKTLTYKYGCSDKSFSHLGGFQLIFWRAIQAAKSDALLCFDLGRSDEDNLGLIAFKDRWGAEKLLLKYWRHGQGPMDESDRRRHVQSVNAMLRHIPKSLLPLAAVMYRHYG